MKVTTLMVTATMLGCGLALGEGIAQAQPIPIREQTLGLLAEAGVSPAAARLAAFAEVPGAQMVAGTIERLADQLVYSFDLKYAGHDGTEQVQIDAKTGKVVCVAYCVGLDAAGDIVMTASPELVAKARISFVAARDSALARVEGGHVVCSRLRVQQSRQVYVFDVEVGETPEVDQILVDANTGAVIGPAEKN